MSLQAHISELETKHHTLKAEIETEQASPSADDLQIAELKRQKLRLKDQIARLRAQAEAA